jgi:hypothetical protein
LEICPIKPPPLDGGFGMMGAQPITETDLQGSWRGPTSIASLLNFNETY